MKICTKRGGAGAGLEDVETVPVRKKRILITGTGSYIGDSVKKYLEDASGLYEAHCISTIGMRPEPEMFRGYDVVFNAAGIAHRKETNENRSLYYEINRDLAVEIAKAAREAGVQQFIHLSSMSVYGKVTGIIRKEDIPYPDSAYGESKLSADEIIETLNSGNYVVTAGIFNPVIRMLPLRIVKKVFGSLIYEHTDTVSRYSFEESIVLSER